MEVSMPAFVTDIQVPENISDPLARERFAEQIAQERFLEMIRDGNWHGLVFPRGQRNPRLMVRPASTA